MSPAYIDTAWAWIIFALTSIVFGMKAYDVFAKMWPATTGRHIARGVITWFEYNLERGLLSSATGGRGHAGLISYAYSAGGGRHNGTIQTEWLQADRVKRELQKGAEIDVYYSPKLPHYSYALKPPSRSVIAATIIAKWFILPLAIFNGLSLFIWFLAQ